MNLNGIGNVTPKTQRRRSSVSKAASKPEGSVPDRGGCAEGLAGDSSWDGSDEGFRSSGNKPEETEERPDSSCTQVSQGSSGGESGGSAEDESGRKKKSKIPLLGPALRAQVRLSSGRKSAEPTPTGRILRSSSVSNSSDASGNSSGFQRRDSFGRHSLRGRPCDAGQRKPTPATPPTSTWSCRNRRERPLLSRDTFTIPAGSGGSGGRMQATPVRSTSASPHSRRRYFGTSVSDCGQSPEARRPASKLVAELLNDVDVELDNDASILKKMEEIVNQYKARVEGILAAEGKTLNHEWENTPPMTPSLPAASSSGFRRNSLASPLASQIPVRRFRKDAPSNPSKIPMPLFYQRSKEACH